MRRTRTFAALAAAGIAALGWVTPIAAAGGEPAGTPPPTSPAGPVVEVVSQTTAVSPGGRFTVVLDIEGAPTSGDIAVDIYDRITDRSDLAAARTPRPNNKLATFDVVPLQSNRPRQQVQFTIHLYDRGQDRPPTAWAYRLTEAGVYPVSIRLRGPDGTALETLVTTLVRRPSADVTAPTPRLAVLATLTPANPLTDVLDPDAVRRLLDAFDEHPDVPATVVVDPDLLDRTARTEDGADLVAELRALVERDDVQLLGAPFTDVDVASLAEAGLGNTYGDLARLGAETLERHLGTDGSATWWAPHPLDGASAFGLQTVGVGHLVVPPGSVIGDAPLVPTPLVALDHRFTVVSTASDLPVGDQDDPLLTAHRWFGEVVATATIAAGRGSATVARIDPTTVDPDVLDEVMSLLEDDAVTTSTVAGLFEATGAATTPIALTAPTYEAMPGYADAHRRVSDQLQSFAGMRADGDAPLEAQQVALARTARAGLAPNDRLALVAQLERSLTESFAPITTAASDRITLGARNATFPLPVHSDAEEPLRVRIRLSSSNRLHLPREDFEAVIEPGRTTISIPIEARTSGDTPLDVTISTPDGRFVLAQSRYTIRSTAVSGMGIVLTVGAAGFLALWWGRHIWRSRQEKRADHPDRDPEGADDDIFVTDTAGPRDVTVDADLRSDAN